LLTWTPFASLPFLQVDDIEKSIKKIQQKELFQVDSELKTRKAELERIAKDLETAQKQLKDTKKTADSDQKAYDDIKSMLDEQEKEAKKSKDIQLGQQQVGFKAVLPPLSLFLCLFMAFASLSPPPSLVRPCVLSFSEPVGRLCDFPYSCTVVDVSRHGMF
jgi:hypothetical protein